MDRAIAVGQYRLDLAFAISARTPAEGLLKWAHSAIAESRRNSKAGYVIRGNQKNLD